MTIADVVARHADSRPDMTLVDYVEVGLPAWRVLARCDVLEPKAISVIDETTMRAISLGIDDPLDLQILLGLDEQVLDPTLTGLVGQEWARDTGSGGKLALTEAGQEVLAAASEIVARELVVPFDYDGLLRRPIPDQNLVDRRRGAAMGLREVPAAPERPPDVIELRGCRQGITRVLRAAGGRREQETSSSPCAASTGATATCCPPSPWCSRREAAGAASWPWPSATSCRSSMRRRLSRWPGRPHRARSTASRDPAPPAAAARAGGPPREPRRASRASGPAGRTRSPRARGRRSRRRGRRASGSGPPPGPCDLNALPVRTVLPHEHAALLSVAHSSSRRRLLMAGGAVTGEHVDGRFLRRLRQTLAAGTLVRIVVSGAAAANENALEALRTAARDYPGLIIDEQPTRDDGALVSDQRFVAYGAFPWLGQLGDRERQLTDTRSLLIREPEAIDEAWARFDGRSAEAAERSPAPRPSRRRRRRGRPRQRGEPSD